MNLSSYLQMPPAPSVSPTPSTALPAGAAAGVGLAAGASLGLDFAKIMARQFERMPSSQRQVFAAPSPSPSPATDNTRTTRANAQAQADDKSQQTAHRQALDAANSDEGSDTRNSQARADEYSSNANDASGQTHTSKRAPHKASPENSLVTDATNANSASPLPSVVSPDTPVTVLAAAPLPTPGTAEVRPQALQANPYLKDVALPSSDAATATPLRTVALSPHMRIITDPRQAPSSESLTAFAKSMGLDEAAIQKLMGPVATSADVQPGAITPSATDTPTELTVSLNPPSAQLTDKLASPLLNVAIQANDNGNIHVNIAALAAPGPNADLTQAIVVNNMAATTVTPTATSTATSTATPTVGAALQGLTPSDLASIQHIQITVLPPAVAQTSAISSTPSTAAVLSLMGSGLNEQDITALAATFESGTTGEDAGQQQASSGDASAGQFGQAMSRQVVPANTSIASSTHAASDVHMSEVYDQLSDKMATEMAARMHKQLSDGEWKMKFGLRPANLGGVEIQLEMKDGKLDAVIHADNPLTRDLLQNSSQRLRDALENFGIHAGQFHIGQDSRGTQQNPSRGSAKQSQVGENSSSQVKSSNSVTSAEAVSTKANASLLDLYA
ncbi:hypothetical protein B9Z39_04480 [Limnohabitans sp. JirII-29]|uniref:flagellar hook-length control protein FliK n=1 Tax=Limnohabitans sp. JirII-29 TaxID=1835756 RepID=UPI000D3AA8AC|nr:flagellar hook-length control protein FliK [Limnohabitans sp. JirII-29]PUE29329.1 hypothetical protein B9Z39_04480 [Limnohabitans sp. JirII-29]